MKVLTSWNVEVSDQDAPHMTQTALWAAKKNNTKKKDSHLNQCTLSVAYLATRPYPYANTCCVRRYTCLESLTLDAIFS